MQTATDLASALDSRLAALWRALGRDGSGGLSRTATAVLANLREHGPQRITDLAAAEAVAQPSMTALITRLERAALVRRGPDADDARAVRVSLTDDGAEALQSMRAARAQRIEARLAALTPAPPTKSRRRRCAPSRARRRGATDRRRPRRRRPS
jgi:DNA-binding MarR family transcriptional regulator